MRSFGELEMRIMRVVWDHPGPVTVRSVLDEIQGDRPAYTTVVTVIERLRAKGWLSRVKQGRSYLYEATSSEGDYAAGLMSSALDGTGNRSAALLSFAGRLEPDEAQTLREALDRVSSPDREAGG